MAVTNSGPKAFTAGGTIPLFARVKLDSGSGTSVVVTGANEKGFGTVIKLDSGSGSSAASGDRVTVWPDNLGGTVKMIASEAISAGADVFPVADGEISDIDTGLSKRVGVALGAASGDQSVIEVLIADAAGVVPVKEEIILGTITASLIADTYVMTRTLYGSGTVVEVFGRAVGAVTTASDETTVTFAIGGVGITTGSVNLTSANMTPDGAEVSATPSGNNAWTDGQALTATFGSTTAFAEGIFEIGVRVVRS